MRRDGGDEFSGFVYSREVKFNIGLTTHTIIIPFVYWPDMTIS